MKLTVHFYIGIICCMLLFGKTAIIREQLDVEKNIDTAVDENDVAGLVRRLKIPKNARVKRCNFPWSIMCTTFKRTGLY